AKSSPLSASLRPSSPPPAFPFRVVIASSAASRPSPASSHTNPTRQFWCCAVWTSPRRGHNGIDLLPPLWGRTKVGGRSPRHGACAVRSPRPCAGSPPTLTLPHKG